MPLSSLSGQFPTSAERFALSYDEGVSAVDFMVRHYGRDALVTLIKSYAAGVTDDDAFQAGIGTDQAGFEAAWLADLQAPAPSPFGPQAAPGGPVPSDWLGGAPVAGGRSISPGGSTLGQPASGGIGGPALVVVAAVVIVVSAGLVLLAIRSQRRPS